MDAAAEAAREALSRYPDYPPARERAAMLEEAMA